MNIRTVLITGAAGYLASFVIERLRPQYELTLTDRVAPREQFANLPFLPGDITSYEEVASVCQRQDAVIHTVALVRERFDKPSWLFADVMVKGTWNVAEACVRQGVQRLVNISSISAVGASLTTDRPHRLDDPSEFRQGDLSYALAKHLGEQIGNAYHQAHGLSVIHLRPGIIARDGKNAEPVAPAQPSGPWFMHVDPRDVAQAVERALVTTVSHGCYHIVAGRKDTRHEWSAARNDLGYEPEFNWPEIPDASDH